MDLPKIADIYKRFPTRESCIRHIENIRWRSRPVCPHCGSSRISSMRREFRYHCNACNTSFSATVKTLFHNTRIPLQKWFAAIEILRITDNRISSRRLAELLQVNKDTAWAMINRIRQAAAEYSELLSALVEMSELYFMNMVNSEA